MLVSQAYAQAGAASGGQDMLFQFLPLILIFVVFYFLLIRPQQKRAKEHREMLAAVRRGDRVVTGGGIIGTVDKVADDELTIQIAENVRVKVMRGTLSSVLSKSEPVGANNPDATAQPTGPVEKPKSLFGRFLNKN
jgi:preprotein translocase subunit YajC